MRKKAEKVILLMVLSLMISLSFVGFAVQANAQEVSGRAFEGEHSMKEEGSFTWYENANSEYHFVYRTIVLKCQDKNCNFEMRDTIQTDYAKHDLRGVAQAPYRFYCLQCGYKE